jgi:hypothetical protein
LFEILRFFSISNFIGVEPAEGHDLEATAEGVGHGRARI